MRTPAPTPHDVLRATGLIAVGSLGVQISAALSVSLFSSLGPFEVSSLRMLVAAVVLVALFRPALRGRSRAEWLGIVLYGLAMAAMNISLYLAIDRIPLGIAVTLEFLGPTAVALAASRRLPEFLCAGLALAGVALISFGPGDHGDPLGYVFALMAGAFFAAYAVLSSRVGKSGSGEGKSAYSGLALSVAVASLVTLPWGAPHIPGVSAAQWGLVAVSAVLGVAIPFTVDTIAGGITSARVVGTLFALDPVIGSLIGLVVLHQALSWTAYAGIGLVAVAGALLVWSAEKPAEDPKPAAGTPQGTTTPGPAS